MRFKVYFSHQQMMARSVNVTNSGNNRFPLTLARLINGVIVPYTQIADEKSNYGCKWSDAMYLGIAYRTDIVGINPDYVSGILLDIDKLEPVKEQ